MGAQGLLPYPAAAPAGAWSRTGRSPVRGSPEVTGRPGAAEPAADASASVPPGTNTPAPTADASTARFSHPVVFPTARLRSPGSDARNKHAQ
ncbi:hypothetical protein GCM10018955_16310 [Planomonospora venezuelensis]